MLIIFIYYVNLPPVTIGVDVTIESLEENEKLVRRYVVLVKEYGVFDIMSTWIWQKINNYWTDHKYHITATYATILQQKVLGTIFHICDNNTEFWSH